jgi:TPR repeat protein
MSGKRKRKGVSDDELIAIAEPFICPITQELPVDPVIAEDGLTYERKDIEQWLGQSGTSPMTRAAMGSRLTPNCQAKNSIERMVRSGKLDCSNIATAWKEKIKNEEEVEELKRKVERGPGKAKALWVGAVLGLGDIYGYGFNGVEEDEPRAFALYQQAADEGSIPALRELGKSYIHGSGVDMNETMGVHLLTEAASKGNEESCYQLGHFFTHGINGLPENPKKAVEWFKKMESCKKSMKDCSIRQREVATAYIASQQVNAAA